MPIKEEKVAIVAGATGVAGRTLTEYLSHQPGWRVIAIARNVEALKEFKGRITLLEADLEDFSSLKQSLEPYQVTHLFYTAWAEHQSGVRRPDGSILVPSKAKSQLEFAAKWIVPQLKRSKRLHDLFYQGFLRAAGLLDPNGRNLRMLQNILRVLDEPTHQLKHATLLTGGRYYGMQFGPSIYPDYKIPFTEDIPPCPGPNTYVGMEGYLQEFARDRFTWSVVRPTFIIGLSPKPSQNIGYALAVYAWLLKSMGLPLIYPGGRDAYEAKGQFSDACLLAEMLTWSAENETAADQIFNLVNGDIVSWEKTWPQIADYFGMQVAVPEEGVDLNELLKDRTAIWAQLRKDQGLPPLPLESVFSANFLVSGLLMNWDAIYSMEKAQSFGFESSVDSGEMFQGLFKKLEDQQIIPAGGLDSQLAA